MLLQHGNFHVACHVVHNIQLLKTFWGRRAALVAMKTKCRSRLNVENYVVCALSYIEPQISMLSNNKQAQPSRYWMLLCFYFCSVHVQQLSHLEKLYSRWDPLFIKSATCLERLRSPGLDFSAMRKTALAKTSCFPFLQLCPRACTLNLWPCCGAWAMQLSILFQPMPVTRYFLVSKSLPKFFH